MARPSHNEPIMNENRCLVPVLVAAALLAPLPARADEPACPEATPRLGESEHFTIDPVVDGVLIVGGFTFAELLSLIISTGEIQPTQPGNPDVLLSIDRVAVTQTIDPNAGMRSSIGLYAAYGYAVLDPILSGVRDGRRALLVDAIMYAESIALTQAFTDATKIGVRRPRPIDYVNCCRRCRSRSRARAPICSSHSSPGTRRPRARSARPPPTWRSCAAARAARGRGSRSAVGNAAHRVRQLRARPLGRALPDRRHHGLARGRGDRRARAALPPPASL